MGREFFIIVAGKAEADRNATPIGVLGPGSFFGEMSLLERKPRAATVTTLEPTSLLVITARDFTSLVETMPSVDRKMLQVLAERLRDIEARFVPAESRVANTELA
jgi:CRP/FNR family cyclic AMP-dependent transcriptional regulator